MNQVSLITIYIPNILGVLLITTAILSNKRYFKEKGAESKLLLFMFVLVFVSCFSDPLTLTINGTPGYLSRMFIFTGHVWTYLANVLMVYCWLLLMRRHMGVKLNKVHDYLLFILVCIEILILFMNLFSPLVFSIDNNNVYQRGSLYFLYYLISAFILIDSVVIYFTIKRKCGSLRTYPIWVYIVAFPAGLALQIMFVGISISWACDAVALTGILCSLQNEMFYRDKVTELYNKVYFDNIALEQVKRNKGKYTIIRTGLLNLNNIIKDFGDFDGNEALKELASLLNDAVDRLGVVIRYDNNEFISIINTTEDEQIEKVLSDINSAISRYNAMDNALFKLGVSVKYAKLDGNRDALEAIFDEESFKKYNLTQLYELDDKVQGINLKKSSFVFIAIEELLVIATIVCAVSTSEKYELITTLNDSYIKLQNDVLVMQEGSDYLTDKSRQFVLTKDIKYAYDYFEELDISKRRENAVAEVNTTLEDLEAGNNQFIDEALQKSKSLSKTEIHAMALIYSLIKTNVTAPIELVDYILPNNELMLLPSQREELALNMLFGELYTDEKEHILSSVKYASSYVLEAIKTQMDKCTVEYNRDSLALKIFLAESAFLYLISIAALIILVLSPLNENIKSIEREKPLKYGLGYEINYLAHSINKLSERNIVTKLHLRDSAEKDSLTGILNRNGFEGVKNYYNNSDEEIACIIIDVDYFKDVNDTYGHDEGDQALVRIAKLLKDMFRETDYVVRYGGDEFLVIMSGTGISSKSIVADKLMAINNILKSEHVEGRPKLSVSIGCAFSDNGYNDELFEKADAALYLTKQKGRCGYSFYQES